MVVVVVVVVVYVRAVRGVSVRAVRGVSVRAQRGVSVRALRDVSVRALRREGCVRALRGMGVRALRGVSGWCGSVQWMWAASALSTRSLFGHRVEEPSSLRRRLAAEVALPFAELL